MLPCKLASCPPLIVLFLILRVPAFAEPMTLSGTPPTSVVAGEIYRFLPLVEHADFSRLEFNYINRPAWSKGYRGSGLIRGTPLEPGVYPGIQIGAWDGSQYALMAPFTITVIAPPAAEDTGTAYVNWRPPTHNTDGSTLEDLAGYRIRYGLSASALDREIIVRPGSATEARIENLREGSWSFEIAAVNAADVPSRFSPRVRAEVH